MAKLPNKFLVNPSVRWFVQGLVDAVADNAGDILLQTTTGDLYVASAPGSGNWGSPVMNLTGPAGDDGADGADGLDGADGADGSGNLWFAGAGVPGGIPVSATATGDLYLNTLNGDVYQALSPGSASWGAPITNIMGPTGAGVPSGGTTGQILAKNSGTNYDTGWIDAPSGGGAIVSESSDFTLDTSVHTNRCTILVEPAAGTGARVMYLMTLASQPSPGYRIEVFMTGASGGYLSIATNSGAANLAALAALRAVVCYLGSNYWSVEIFSNGLGAGNAIVSVVLENSDA